MNETNTNETTQKQTNNEVWKQIRALGKEKKAKRAEVVKAVDKLWADYAKWRDEECATKIAELRKFITDRHDERVAKRANREADKAKKAEEKEAKAKERAEKKAKREAEKAAKAAEKAAAKAKKAEEKAAAKAAKAAEAK